MSSPEIPRAGTGFAETAVLVSGLGFLESPRWHDGSVWLVDVSNQSVLRAELDGSVQTVRKFHDLPGGIGFLPGGIGIVALMQSKRLMRIDTGELYADLSDLPGSNLNDVVVDAFGRLYVDLIQVPPHLHDVSKESGDAIVVVEADGTVAYAGRGGMHRPNGLAISPDGRFLVAAMLPTRELVKYPITVDGRLGPGATFADLGRVQEEADGICMDVEGAVWCGSPHSGHFVRVQEGGAVTHVVDVHDRHATACALGGPNGDLLLMVTAKVAADPSRTAVQNLLAAEGLIEVVRVDVPGP